MLVDAFPAIPMIVIDAILAGTMLTAGLLAGRLLFRKFGPTPPNDSDKARDALTQIRELASTVARDVGEHSHRMHEATSELQGIKDGDPGAVGDVVLRTVADMLSANEQLQAQLASAEERLQQQAAQIEVHLTDARTDQLTKLNNRRVFDSELARLFAEWQTTGTSFALYMIDVDHFKKFNDVHGHQAGDEVLRGVARTLKAAARPTDIVCRYGGEEFAVILPATRVELGQELADRSRQAIQAALFRFEQTELKVTASLGVTEILSSEEAVNMVRRADEALYAAKKAGRNNVHWHDGQTSFPVQPVAPLPKKVEKAAAPPQPDPVLTVPTPTLDGLAGRETFVDELRRRIAEAQRFNLQLSVILVNVDNYKLLAGKYGQPIGSLMLDTVAQYLEILLRDMDLLARYDGGKFAILLPGTPVANAGTVGQRIRDSVAACVIPLGDTTLNLSVTGGIAGSETSDDPRTLLERAESALATARAHGSGSVFLHDGRKSFELESAEVAAG